MTEMRPDKADLYRWSKIRVPESNGDNRWHSYIIQFNTIMKINDCRDNDAMVCKLVEALRGRALDYFESFPGELRFEFVTLYNLFEGRFGRQEPQSTVDEAMRLMKRFNSHEKSLSKEKRVQTLAFEERAPANPQIYRVQERGSPALDVSELNDSIGKLTKLTMGMSTRETRSGVLRCFRCNKEGYIARYCKMDVNVVSSTSGKYLEKNS